MGLNPQPHELRGFGFVAPGELGQRQGIHARQVAERLDEALLGQGMAFHRLEQGAVHIGPAPPQNGQHAMPKEVAVEALVRIGRVLEPCQAPIPGVARQ